MLWTGEDNVFLESVEEKTNAKQWEFSCTTFHLTLQTAIQLKQKQLNIILKIKTSKLTFQSLIIGAGHQPKRWVKYPLRLTGYTCFFYFLRKFLRENPNVHSGNFSIRFRRQYVLLFDLIAAICFLLLTSKRKSSRWSTIKMFEDTLKSIHSEDELGGEYTKWDLYPFLGSTGKKGMVFFDVMLLAE